MALSSAERTERLSRRSPRSQFSGEVRWLIGERESEAGDFPLRATLRGPDEEQESAAGPGLFRFKGGFTTAIYALQLRNESEDANAAVEVRWTVR